MTRYYDEPDRYPIEEGGDVKPFFGKVEEEDSEAPATDFEIALRKEIEDVYQLLCDKNRKYGNSVIEPVRVFSKASPLEQIRVRMDDKISRLMSAQVDDNEDAKFDLLGYLLIERVYNRIESKKEREK